VNTSVLNAGRDVRYERIRVHGKDAVAFLNAQLTRRVDDLAAGESRLAAWCNAKGRVLALFRIARAVDGYDLRLPACLIGLILPRLQMFVLRSQVQLTHIADDAHSATALPRAEEIRAGIPEVYPETREAFLPQMINLDRLGAIDFNKGCYPGQEIVARAQYRGQVKRRMYLFAADAGPAPPPGAELSSEGEQSGTVVDAVTGEKGGLLIQAVIPVEAAQLSWQLASTGDRLKLLSPERTAAQEF
jgi:folate-binding protein YgfZ